MKNKLSVEKMKTLTSSGIVPLVKLVLGDDFYTHSIR
jgi:hypothetical protein